MHFTSSILPIFLLAACGVEGARKPPKDAILLSSVKTLTLRANAKTSHRRVSAIPQLTCSGPGCKHHTVDVMRCKNMGSSYGTEDIEWTCVADLPVEFKLGSTEVTCEGYSSSDDEAVLKGSCGVAYRLLLTDKGEEKYGSSWFGGSKNTNNNPKVYGEEEGLGLPGWLFIFLFIGVLIWILYKMGERANNQRARPRRQPRGPGFGGGWGGGDDPPPPYDGHYPGKPSSAGQEGWRPGFWSGAAAGVAGAYMAGNRGNSRTQETSRQDGSGRAGRSSRFGSSGSSSSSTTHSSSGFGGTSRR